jgi:5S rRNA maturation endonuclease (ribonuclease M5)
MTPLWVRSIQRSFIHKIKDDEVLIKTCPYCNNTKWNLQLNFSGIYHCWACGSGGHITRFFKDQDIEYDSEDLAYTPSKKKEAQKGTIQLPANKPLRDYSDSRVALIAKEYLISRHVSSNIIEEWDFRLATGEDEKELGFNYFGYVVVPLYGEQGLEYYVANTYYRDRQYKYRLPDKDKNSVFLPRKRGSDSIVIVEGLYDAISVWQNTQYDVIMLLGKFLSDFQTESLAKCNYKKVFCCLDGDALKENLALANRLYRYQMPAYVVKLPEDKDPDDCQKEISSHINNAVQVKTGTFLKERLKCL